jgi:hypothetical protein
VSFIQVEREPLGQRFGRDKEQGASASAAVEKPPTFEQALVPRNR